MTIVLLFLKRYWKHILIVIVLISISAYLYNKVYNIGYAAANADCVEKIAAYEQKMTEYKASLDDRIKMLEESSNTLVVEAIEARKIIKEDYKKILSSVKGKPLVIIEKDKCVPSIDFIRAYNEAVARANK